MLSEKTRLEMEAGAKALAVNNGIDEALAPEYMAAIIRTQQRMRQLQIWENDRKVEIEYTSHMNVGRDGMQHRAYVHVLDANGRRWTAFDDALAERCGGWPSEVLMANIALALQAQGMA